jgi:hypothetical protein
MTPHKKQPGAEKRTDTVILADVREVWATWKVNRHKWRSSNAMVTISEILTKAEPYKKPVRK